MEEDVKRVDYALIRNMVRLDMAPDQIHVRGLETRRHKEFEYTFQNIEVDLDGPPEQFLTGLLESLVEWAPDASLTQVNATVWELSVHYVPTHILHLKEPAFGIRPPRQAEPPGGPRLAIVIDDLGESTADARHLAELDYPITFSVWPRATRTTAVAEIGYKAGLDILIHQPMEPMGYPEVSPGPGAVYVAMNPMDIRRVVAENIALVPHAKGMNNHMGSRFTQDRDGVGAVLRELRGHGLFVLDSLTPPPLQGLSPGPGHGPARAPARRVPGRGPGQAGHHPPTGQGGPGGPAARHGRGHRPPPSRDHGRAQGVAVAPRQEGGRGGPEQPGAHPVPHPGGQRHGL